MASPPRAREGAPAEAAEEDEGEGAGEGEGEGEGEGGGEAQPATHGRQARWKAGEKALASFCSTTLSSALCDTGSRALQYGFLPPSMDQEKGLRAENR